MGGRAINGMGGWAGVDWSDLAEVQARLAAGADLDAAPGRWPPLLSAVERGSPEVVSELASRVNDIEAIYQGRTALWSAVWADRPDHARALVAAGADPWRPLAAGWSPGRLSLAGRTPDLFPLPPGIPSLNSEESTAIARARRLCDLFKGIDSYDGYSFACVSGIDVAEAVRRLSGEVVAVEDWDRDMADLIVGVTEVPGGCVVFQPWAYWASTPRVGRLLSVGTSCHAMYSNPKSGNQGSIFRDGVMTDRDTHPGGDWFDEESAEDVLRAFLYQYAAVAYCWDYVGLNPVDVRAFTGPPDLWIEMPAGDYWGGSA